ncbi:MAG: polysaccharide biosynthesis protein, partial [Eubacteriales bacterium]|nr:polysaccharide biosynthesis protein [Eubacteriales bacterium]
KTILVTGGGGSIGSELCRQLAKLEPARLVVFDIYENNAYDIEQELIRKYGDRLNLSIEIGSVRDEERLREVFETYHPQIVFHAAAHKHVPLMEHSCGEAIKNNVFGTLNIANIAEEYGVERFLLVSTDKAVNPTNVMGASKRLCEMIIQSKKDSRTNFVAVRFGNVLGSNGSVIPLFKKQIASGGPITLTDKRIIRYFMTIPEAAQLLLQTCAMASPGEIYVLDMGMPVKILELAENMIRLSGLTPYVDIDIQEIGLRPGEKLYEELLMKTEELDKTDNKMIFIERDQALTEEQLQEKLEVLKRSLTCQRQQAVIEAMRQTVPTYHCAEDVNQEAEQAEEMMACGTTHSRVF